MLMKTVFESICKGACGYLQEYAASKIAEAP